MKKLNSTYFSFKKYFFTVLIGFTFSISSVSGAVIAWSGSGGTDTNWTNPLNWVGGVVPTSADQVAISGGYTVTISNDVGTIDKLVLNTSAAAAPKLIITSTGVIDVNSPTAGQTQVTIAGGAIENAGTLSISCASYTGSAIALNFVNASGGFIAAGSYSGTGVLSINSVLATTGTCINFAQSNATPTLTVDGIFVLSAPVGKWAITAASGSNTKINGNGTLSAGTKDALVNFGLLNVTASVAPTTVTIESGVTLNSFTNFAYTTSSGPVYLGSIFGNTVTNKGTLNIGGNTSNTGIYSGATTSIVNNFDNQGTINLSGAFITAAIATGGAGTFNLTNSGTIKVDNLGAATAKGITMTTAATVNINNTGTITFGSNGLNTGPVIYMGDSKTTFNNSGIITSHRGYLSGQGTTNAIFNNNEGGVVGIYNTQGSGYFAYTYLIFTNKGTIEGFGNFPNGSFIPSTGTISPAGTTGYGKINFFQATTGSPTFNLTGTCLMNVKGKAVAGTDYDQITVSTAGSSLNVSGANLEVILDPSYTPADKDTVVLFTGNTALIGTFASMSLPTGWRMEYGTTKAEIVYRIPNAINEIEGASKLIYGIRNAIVVNDREGKQITVLNIAGQALNKFAETSNQQQIPMNKGFYIVQVGNLTKKVLVE